MWEPPTGGTHLGVPWGFLVGLPRARGGRPGAGAGATPCVSSLHREFLISKSKPPVNNTHTLQSILTLCSLTNDTRPRAPPKNSLRRIPGVATRPRAAQGRDGPEARRGGRGREAPEAPRCTATHAAHRQPPARAAWNLKDTAPTAPAPPSCRPPPRAPGGGCVAHLRGHPASCRGDRPSRSGRSCRRASS